MREGGVKVMCDYGEDLLLDIVKNKNLNQGMFSSFNCLNNNDLSVFQSHKSLLNTKVSEAGTEGIVFFQLVA